MNDGRRHLTELNDRAIAAVYDVDRLTPDEALTRLRRIRTWRYQADLFNRNRREVSRLEKEIEAHLVRLGVPR